MTNLLKSIDGIPYPILARGVRLADEARKARGRFYPVTLLYSLYAAPVFFFAFRARPRLASLFLVLGVGFWTYLEYIVHRHVLHGRFPDGPGFWTHQLHVHFDPMHANHHQRPWDGMFINGYLSSLPFAVVLGLLSWVFPVATAPVFIAVVLQCYVIEEWVHYTVHFHRFRWKYFQYIRRHHLYHHSPRGTTIAFGLTSGIWDVLADTRIPESERQRLHGARSSTAIFAEESVALGQSPAPAGAAAAEPGVPPREAPPPTP
jgi:sterol desaturase/sphingolipid hydroxylase (fatty acid hydroxylase superfamily)